MPRLVKQVKRKILIIFFFLTFFTNLYAETISSSETRTSSTSVTEDYTINTGVSIIFLNHQKGLRVQESDITIKNYGTLTSTEDDESTIQQTITGTGTDGAYDLQIFNYGTITQEDRSAIFVPNNDDQNGDGVGVYIYNEGTITSSDNWTIRYHSSDYTKIDNYGTIKQDSGPYALMGYSDNYSTINNYSGATIYAAGSRAIASKKAPSLSSNTTINNWGNIEAANWTIELGTNSTLNNYGKILIHDWSTSTDDAIIMLGNNNTVNLYDGTIIMGDINASSTSGSTLNLDLCSSYYFKVESSWNINNISGCGELVYSGGFAQSVSPLFQSVADEIGVLRTDLINDVYDFAKDKMENDESFGLPLKSYTKRERGKSINNFASNANGFAFGFPSESDKIKGHLVFNILNNNIDLLNQNIKDETYQVGFFLKI